MLEACNIWDMLMILVSVTKACNCCVEHIMQSMGMTCYYHSTTDGVISQSIPIVLPVNNQDKESLTGAAAIALIYNGKRVAVLRNPELFPHRKEERCSRQFGTSNQGHPYIKVTCCCHCVIITLSLYHLYVCVPLTLLLFYYTHTSSPPSMYRSFTFCGLNIFIIDYLTKI